VIKVTNQAGRVPVRALVHRSRVCSWEYEELDRAAQLLGMGPTNPAPDSTRVLRFL